MDYLQQKAYAASSVNQRLAALRHLFDWLLSNQIVPTNPAASVRSSTCSVKVSKTPALTPDEARALLDSIPVTTVAGLRDRALIGLMLYAFVRVGAAVDMKVEDIYYQNHRLWVRLRRKGKQPHTIPCHHHLEAHLTAYIVGAGLDKDPKGPLFRTIGRTKRRPLTRTALPQANAYAMIHRRVKAARIAAKLGNHSLRATGIIAYLRNGGALEKAAQMADYASTRTLYVHHPEEVSLDEVEGIQL